MTTKTSTSQWTKLTAANPVGLSVVAMTLVAAVLRIATLGEQSVWYDEAHTMLLIHGSFSRMLSLIHQHETTPPLYFIIAWLWAHVVGYSAFAVRLISAVAGALVVLLAFLIGRRLASIRAGLIAAALTTLSPMLMWYSQEARAYSLMVLLSSVALLAFAELREKISVRWLCIWVASAILALGTHYFTALALVPEAVWLLVSNYRDKRIYLALLLTACAGAALIPEMSHQAYAVVNGGWIATVPLGARAQATGLWQLLGPSRIATPAVLTIDLLVVALAAILIIRSPRARRVARPTAVILAAGLVIFALVMVTGHDVLDPRNLLALWLPMTLTISIGLADLEPRVARVCAVGAICLAGLVTILAVSLDPRLQRPDWRRVAQIIGNKPHGLVYGEDECTYTALAPSYYLPSLKTVSAPVSATSFYVLKASSQPTQFDVLIGDWYTICAPQTDVVLPKRIGGFVASGRPIKVQQFTLQRYTSRTPRMVQPSTFAGIAPAGGLLFRPGTLRPGGAPRTTAVTF
jgi:mannosyltransferase